MVRRNNAAPPRARPMTADRSRAMPVPPPADLPPFWGQFLAWSSRSPEFAQLIARASGEQATLWREWIEGQAQASGGAGADAARRDGFFGFLKAAHGLNARFLQSAVELAALEPKAKGQLRFFMRQYVDALAPANFLVTNPEAMKVALESDGASLQQGVANLMADMARGRISTVDESAFEVGRNLATTPGSVIFRNDLIELIQYASATPQVHARPLLMVPPCINKFYVLDLQPENSLVRHAIAAGHTVFMVSWRNPTAAEGHLGWDDYIERGALAAIDVVRRVSGQRSIDMLGFCVGGTILSTALAVLAARGDQAASSLTLLATLLDFTDAGEIGCFVDKQSVAGREALLAQGGILSGNELVTVFSALRDNDLVWSYVVRNYLKGGRPAAFDILYWNADSTNLPGPMFCWYVRNLYLENRLAKPGDLIVCGEPVDLGTIEAPACIVATREDHIVPWQSAYASTHLLGGDVEFILGASGHIAGIVNPPEKRRRSHWRQAGLNDQPEQWLASATEHPGSWWTHWLDWLAPHSGKRIRKPRAVGGHGFAALEPAPGTYVRHRI